MMKRWSLLLAAVLAAVLLGPPSAVADDDDDDGRRGKHDEDHERRESKRSSGGGRKDGGLAAPSDPTWKAECGSCHLAFPPGFLPERSWRKMMTGLDDHFGENAGLDPKVRDEITKFLVANAADHAESRRSRKIARGIPAGDTPLRITETSWFRREHDDFSAAVWKRPAIGTPAHCAACHRGAEANSFSEHDVVIPR